jgi:hypothetical protein
MKDPLPEATELVDPFTTHKSNQYIRMSYMQTSLVSSQLHVVMTHTLVKPSSAQSRPGQLLRNAALPYIPSKLPHQFFGKKAREE